MGLLWSFHEAAVGLSPKTLVEVAQDEKVRRREFFHIAYMPSTTPFLGAVHVADRWVKEIVFGESKNRG
jgi:hypothetical protein